LARPAGPTRCTGPSGIPCSTFLTRRVGSWDIGVDTGLTCGAIIPFAGGIATGAKLSRDAAKIGRLGGDVGEFRRSVRIGEAGSYSDLTRRSVVGDEIDIHHIPQAAAQYTSRSEGGALALTHFEHTLTRTYGFRGVQFLSEDASISFRQVLARDIWDVRSIAGTRYNAGLLDLIQYYRVNFPDLMAKGGAI
jgi:hypothetical protein